MINFDLNTKERNVLWEHLLRDLENHYSLSEQLNVAPTLDEVKIREYIFKSFDVQVKPKEALDHILEGMKKFTVHTSHPAYYGLFNPKANFPSILADTITAVFNPQLAAWSHAPFAVEIEQKLVKEFGMKFGYTENNCDGVFTTGGAEANLTAVLSALNYHFPNYVQDGLRSLKKPPVIYCSSESHHSILKAAGIVGLGLSAVRNIPVNSSLELSVEELEKYILEDTQQGNYPLMIVATMGTTGAGAIDPVIDISSLAKKHGLWLHADAAYGGAAILSTQYRYLLDGIELADSITFDAHKWMSVTMSASLFLTKHTDILNRTFRITADYMPKEAGSLKITDPFTHSIQWSRRFIGLKLYLSLLFFGWKGYEEVIDHQILMGKLLKEKLQQKNWIIFNDTLLPILCFGKECFTHDEKAALELSRKLIDTGKVWLSVYKVNNINCLRTCITNYITKENELNQLIDLLTIISKDDACQKK